MFVKENNPKNRYGASAKSLIGLAKSKSYELFAVSHCNCFFIQKTFFHHLNIIDNSLFTLRTDYSSVCSIFFGYDGTIFLQGNTQNPWTGLNLHENEIQIIPYWINTLFKGRMAKRIYRAYRLNIAPHCTSKVIQKSY